MWWLQGVKAVIALVVVAVVVPLMVGVLMELVIVIPLRVPLHQTPILFLWQVSVTTDVIIIISHYFFTALLKDTAIYTKHVSKVYIRQR